MVLETEYASSQIFMTPEVRKAGQTTMCETIPADNGKHAPQAFDELPRSPLKRSASAVTSYDLLTSYDNDSYTRTPHIRKHNVSPESGGFLILKPEIRNVSKFGVWISYLCGGSFL